MIFRFLVLDITSSVSKTDSSSSKSLLLPSLQEDKSINISPDEILLLPLTGSSNLPSLLSRQQQQKFYHDQSQYNYPRRLQSQLDTSERGNIAPSHHILQELRQEFENWINWQ